MGNCLTSPKRVQSEEADERSSKVELNETVVQTIVERVISRFSSGNLLERVQDGVRAASKAKFSDSDESTHPRAAKRAGSVAASITETTRTASIAGAAGPPPPSTPRSSPPAAPQSPRPTDARKTPIKSAAAPGGGGNPLQVPRQDSPFYVIRKTKAVQDDYNIGEELGHGQFGVVNVAVCKRTKKRYAMKSISKRKAEYDPNFRKDIRTEVEIMYHLGGHPNIIQLYDVYEDADTINLILELCEGGDWFQRLLANGTYSEVMAASTTRAILETLAYCHSLGVVHRDIKPENVLLADRTDKTAIKLADFGLSAMLPRAAMLDPLSKAGNPKALLYDAVGTAYYVAPEVLMARVYGKEVDIWSMGVVLYIVLGGYAPFDGASEQEILHAIVYQALRFDDPTWCEISNSAKDVIGRMLTKDPRKRATIPELLEHPWLNLGVTPPKPGLGPYRARCSSAVVPDAVVTRLQQFAAMNRFKKEARKVLAMFLPEEEVIGLLSIFKEMDTDGDGVLTLAELKSALSGKGIKIGETRVQSLLNRVDINDDEVIDYQEFLAATVHQLRLDKDELLYKAFQRFDRDKTGFINRDDLIEALKHVKGPPPDVDAVLKAVDTDCDGRINYEEFCNYLNENDAFEEELDSLKSSSSRYRFFSHSGNESSGPRPLLNSMSSRRRDRSRDSQNRGSGPRDSRTSGARDSRTSRRTTDRSDKSLKSSIRRRETSDPGLKDDIGNKSVRFREVPEVSAYSTTCPREKHGTHGHPLDPLTSSSSMNSRTAPWEHQVLNSQSSRRLLESMRSSMALSLRSSLKRREDADAHKPSAAEMTSEETVMPSRPSATKKAGALGRRRMTGTVVNRNRSRSRSRSQNQSRDGASSKVRGRDLVRDASSRHRAEKPAGGSLHATPSLTAAAAAAAAVAAVDGGSRKMGRPTSRKGRPVTLPNSASSRHLSCDGSRSFFASSSDFNRSSRSLSPDRETDDFSADPNGLLSLRTHTLPVTEQPPSPSLLEFRRHSCIAPQAPDLAPPDRRNPRTRVGKSHAAGTMDTSSTATPPPPSKPHTKAWS